MANRKTKSPHPSAPLHPSALPSAPRNRLPRFSVKDLVGPEAWKIYQRLRKDRRVANVKTWLLKHGMKEKGFDPLLQTICVLPPQAKNRKAGRQRVLPRLEHIRHGLQKLVELTRGEPGLKNLLINLEEHIPPPGKLPAARERRHVYELNPLLERIVAQIGNAVANTATAQLRKRSARRNSGRRFRPLPPDSVVILQIFDLLRGLLPPPPNSDAVLRGLNQNVEILASVVLNRPISAGTVTKLRDGERRPYGAREKNAR